MASTSTEEGGASSGDKMLFERSIKLDVAVTAEKKRTLDVAVTAEKKRVLVIGGTQFMGVHTVEALLRAGFAVTVLNRGVSPWPFGADAPVARIVADRSVDRGAVADAVASAPWAAIVDFAAFCAEDARDVAAAACAPAGAPLPVYVYVSSDSVFMACDRAPIAARRAAGEGLGETDATRARGRRAVGRCRDRDAYQYEYGSGKLAAEEELDAWRAARGLRATSLRLPDVFGARDNLGGFLELYERVAARTVGALVPGVGDGAAHRASLAYGPDVAAAIVAIVEFDGAPPPVLHLACAEAPSVRELVRMVAAARGLPAPALDAGRRALLLTVDVGPLSIARALAALDWTPTPLAAAVAATVAWYDAPENRRYTRRLAGGAAVPDDGDESATPGGGDPRAGFAFNFS